MTAAVQAKGMDRRIQRWFEQGLRAHRDGRHEDAGRLYRQVLALRPAHVDALHYLGVLAHTQGRSDEAVAMIGRALAADPAYVDAHNNLGNVHKESGRPADAEACYRRALALRPQHHDAIGNLAVVLELQGRLDDAFGAYGLLLSSAPDHARGHYLLGLFLRNHAQDEAHARQSVECFRRAWELDRRNLRALEALGIGLYVLGRVEEARGVYATWLEHDPDSPLARHMLAACGGAEAPPRAGDAYVRELFDGFAESFDEQLLNNLEYRAPALLSEALAARIPAAGDLDVLDAGCGTGLCAPLLRPFARRLVGVDLSGGMVEKARLRGGYDTLVVAELTGFLAGAERSYEVIVSADTLVYFGALHAVAAAAHGALRPGGCFAFTVEALEDEADRVELGVSGRYRHSRAHLDAALAEAGFEVPDIVAATLRKEGGGAVAGYVVLARRPA